MEAIKNSHTEKTAINVLRKSTRLCDDLKLVEQTLEAAHALVFSLSGRTGESTWVGNDPWEIAIIQFEKGKKVCETLQQGQWTKRDVEYIRNVMNLPDNAFDRFPILAENKRQIEMALAGAERQLGGVSTMQTV